VTRALASLAVAVLLVAGLAAGPAGARSQDATPILEVVLAGISTVVGPRTPLVYRVTVRNRGPEPVGDLHVQAGLGQPVDTRSALASLLAVPGGQIPGMQPLDDFRPAVVEVAAGARQRLEARQVPLPAGLGEGRAGVVLPLAIRVEATGPAGTVEARLATFVVVLPARVDQPLRAALLVPLHEPTHRNPGEDFVDDKLAGLLAPGGALGAAAAELAREDAPPATMVVDALLVEEATAMVGGWRLRRGGKRTTVPASDQTSRDADAFLRRLKDSAGNQRPAAFPYANADLPALVRAGPGRGDQALQLGRDLLENGLGTAPDETLAWPVDGAIDGAVLQTLDQNGGEVVVLDPRHLPAPPTGVTHNATVALGGGPQAQRALVGDATLSAALADPRSETAPVEWAQRVLAETAVAWLERPNSTDPRGILLAPPHDWRPAPTFFRSLVRGLGDAAWLRPQTASRLAAEVPQGPDEGERRLATVTAADVAAGLPRAYLDRVEQSRRKLKSFQRAVGADFQPAGGGNPDRPDRNLLVAESSDWRPDAARAKGRGFIRAVDQGIRTVYRRIEVGSTPVTLTARRGIIPITLANQSDERITVVLRLTSPKVDLPAASEPFVLEPRRRTTQRLEVGTRTTGTFPIRVEVLTPDRREIIAGGDVRLISTAFNRVALALTGGAAGVLLLWWRLRLRRRPEAGTRTDG
jgi:Family of unknown function (DUF6049)